MNQRTDPDTEDQVRLRALANRIKEMLDEEKVGGMFCLTSPESAEWLTVFPDWAGVSMNQDGSVRVQLRSKDADHANQTMHFLMAMRDLAVDYATMFTHVTDRVVKLLKDQGAEFEHNPFAGVGHGPSGKMKN